MSLKHQLVDGARRGLEVVTAFVAASKGSGARDGDASIDGIADSGDLNDDLTELLETIGQVAQQGGTGALFLLDELQNLDRSALGAICQAMHHVSQEALPVAFAGAGLPDLPRLLAEARPYSNRLFSTPNLAALSPEAAVKAIRKPAESKGFQFEPDALEAIVDLSGGYPYFIQEFGRVLWNEIETSPVSADDVESVHEIVREALAVEFFDPQFALATDAEQRYLLAMAGLGPMPCSSGDVTKALKRTGKGGSSKERDSLIKKELIWVPRRGQVEFTLPQFGNYLLATVSPG